MISYVLRLGLILSFVLPCAAQSVEDQPGMKEILGGEVRIAFLGVDLSRTTFVGGPEDWPGADFIKSLNPAWNNLLAYDLRKYRILSRALRVKTDMIEFYSNICTVHNNDLNFNQAITANSNSQQFTIDDIRAIISSYNFADLSGVGMMAMIETFDAQKNVGQVHFAFLNLDTHELIYSERLTGKPMGNGPRKYWVETIHDGLTQIEGLRYRSWKKEFLK